MPKLKLICTAGEGGDDPNNRTHARQWLTSLVASERLFSARVRSSLGLYFSQLERDVRNPPHAGDTTDSSDDFLSRSKKIQSDHEWLLGDLHTLRLGLSWREESGSALSMYNGTRTQLNDKSQAIGSESVTYLYDDSRWFGDLGLRADQSSKLGGLYSYRASLGRYLLEQQTKAYVSYGTGYKLPSLYQLYSQYGDARLQEENSSTAELTVEQRLGANSSLSLSGFQNRYRELIDFNTTTNRYFNLSQAKSAGVELQASSSISPLLTLLGTYTYLSTQDQKTGLELIRRPNHVVSLTSRFFYRRYRADLQYTFRGRRADVDANNFQRMISPAYSLVSLGMGLDLLKTLKLHGRIENLFNQSYQEVAGYGTPGRSLYLGLSGEL